MSRPLLRSLGFAPLRPWTTAIPHAWTTEDIRRANCRGQIPPPLSSCQFLAAWTAQAHPMTKARRPMRPLQCGRTPRRSRHLCERVGLSSLERLSGRGRADAVPRRGLANAAVPPGARTVPTRSYQRVPSKAGATVPRRDRTSATAPSVGRGAARCNEFAFVGQTRGILDPPETRRDLSDKTGGVGVGVLISSGRTLKDDAHAPED